MNSISPVKSERCHLCGTPSAPQIFKIVKGDQLVTEGHYVCSNPRCRCRFRIATIATETIVEPNKNE